MQDISFGIYLHVPFCARRCAFCKFYKRAPSKEDAERYIDGVSAEVSRFLNSPRGAKLNTQTMFWGGGTPTALSEGQIEKLAEILSPLKPSKEWTVEVAPATVSESKLRLLKDLGVNRISLGVQSFDEKTLASLGRPHSIKSALASVEKIAKIGFEKFGIDLIFGAKGQTPDEWKSDIIRATELPVNHISAYCLEFESATSCCGGVAKGDYEKLGRDGDFLDIAMSEIPAHGFPQYEISNYAKLGKECLHNTNTWKMQEWRGFGPAAASQWAGRRFRNVADLNVWHASQIHGDENCLEDIVPLDDDEMLSSALIFGLRMCAGVDLKELAERFPKSDITKYDKSIKFLESKGLVELKGTNLRLTREGRFVADSVALELL